MDVILHYLTSADSCRNFIGRLFEFSINGIV